MFGGNAAAFENLVTNITGHAPPCAGRSCLAQTIAGGGFLAMPNGLLKCLNPEKVRLPDQKYTIATRRMLNRTACKMLASNSWGRGRAIARRAAAGAGLPVVNSSCAGSRRHRRAIDTDSFPATNRC